MLSWRSGRRDVVGHRKHDVVSMVDRSWVERHFPGETIYPVSAFLDKDLHVQAANETAIKFDGGGFIRF